MADRIPGLEELRNRKRHVRDLANGLDRLSKVGGLFADALGRADSNLKDIASRITEAQKAAGAAGLIGDTRRMNEQLDLVKKLDTQLKNSAQTWRLLGKVVGDVAWKAFDKLNKALITTAFNIGEMGINALISGIQRVYELQERWTKAMGNFNKRVGALSPNMKLVTKEALRWEGTIRGLTDNFGEGLELFQDYLEGFQRILPDAKQQREFGTLGIQLARGFNLGGEAAGAMLKTFYQLDESRSDITKTWAVVVSGAQQAGIPVNAFAKEIQQSSEYMVEFGKSGQKAFIQSAAYARRYGVALKDLEKFAKTFDKFDDATVAAAKLNTVFGTTINSLELMLEQDPGKRFEMVRKELLAQGKTYDTLSRSQRQFLADQLHLTNEEVAGMLKSGDSLEDFRAKQEKAQLNEQRMQKEMQRALHKTATTMYAFGAAADRITVAIANAIKPFLQLLGLAPKGGKEFKSFAQVMESVTKTVVGFFNGLAENDDWYRFMQKMADVVKRVAVAIHDQLTGDNLRRNIAKVIDLVKSLYTWSRNLVAVWATLKIGKALLGGYNAIKGIGGGAEGVGAGGGAGGIGRFGRAAAVGGSVLAGGIGGYATGGTGGAIGGAIGGLAGLIHPLLGPLGAALGASIGKAVGELFKSDGEKELEKSLESRVKAEQRLADVEQRGSIEQMERDFQEHKAQVQQNQFQRVLDRAKKGNFHLTAQENELVQERIVNFKRLGIRVTDIGKASELTGEQLDALTDAEKAYRATVDELKTQADALAGALREGAGLQQNQIDLQKDKLEADRAQFKVEQGAKLIESFKKTMSFWDDQATAITKKKQLELFEEKQRLREIELEKKREKATLDELKFRDKTNRLNDLQFKVANGLLFKQGASLEEKQRAVVALLNGGTPGLFDESEVNAQVQRILATPTPPAAGAAPPTPTGGHQGQRALTNYAAKGPRPRAAAVGGKVDVHVHLEGDTKKFLRQTVRQVVTDGAG